MNKSHQTAMKKIIIISVLTIVGILLTILIISIYVNNQSDDLLAITFACTTGIKPGTLGLRSYDNGTHTIDFNSCAWIDNLHYKSVPDEYQKIHKMSCSEIIERHSTGRPYQDNRNRAFAEAKISSCNFVDRWEEAQKKIDDWG